MTANLLDIVTTTAPIAALAAPLIYLMERTNRRHRNLPSDPELQHPSSCDSDRRRMLGELRATGRFS